MSHLGKLFMPETCFDSDARLIRPRHPLGENFTNVTVFPFGVYPSHAANPQADSGLSARSTPEPYRRRISRS